MAQMLLTPIASTLTGLPDCAAAAVAPCRANFVGGPNSINVNRLPDPTPHASWQVWSGFIEDTWKISPKVTANLGLRYDFQRNAEAPDGAAANLLVEGSTPRYVMAADRCRENLSPTFLAQLAADRIAIECADSNMLVTSPRNLFAPRLGLSYAFADDWVVRAGGGMFYLTSGTSGRNGGNNLVHTQLIYPFAYGVTITNNTPGLPVIYGDGSRGTFESGIEGIRANDPTAFNAFNLSLGGVPSPWKIPLTIQYNVTLQHQLTESQSVSVGYVGSQSRNQDLGFSAYNYNAVKVMAPPGLNATTFRQFPNFNGINQIMNIGKAEYNALQLSYDKLFTQGFAAKANYTYSECRNQGRQGLINNIGGYRSLWLLGPDWALCDSDAPHIMSFSLGYDLPFGQGQRFGSGASGLVDQLIGGWRINAIAMYQSGPPFTIPCNIRDDDGAGLQRGADGRAAVSGEPQLRGMAQPGGVHESARGDHARADRSLADGRRSHAGARSGLQEGRSLRVQGVPRPRQPAVRGPRRDLQPDEHAQFQRAGIFGWWRRLAAAAWCARFQQHGELWQDYGAAHGVERSTAGSAGIEVLLLRNCRVRIWRTTVLRRPLVVASRCPGNRSTEPLPAGNETAGAAIVAGKGNCQSCHRIFGKGSRLGPDLTDIGSLRSPEQLEDVAARSQRRNPSRKPFLPCRHA